MSQLTSCCLQDVGLPQLLLQHHICLHAVMVPAMMRTDLTSEIVSEPPKLNLFLIKVVLVSQVVVVHAFNPST